MSYNQFGSPFSMAGKGCSKSDGGSGCVKKVSGQWVVMNNKKVEYGDVALVNKTVMTN